jgi:hypothetical protein
VPSALFAEMEEFTSLSQIGASSDGLSTWVQKKRERFFRTAILNYQINGKGKWNEFNQKKKVNEMSNSETFHITLKNSCDF